MSHKTQLLKHKPGLISKNRRLDTLLKDDASQDPLGGNYTLLRSDGIVVSFQGFSDQLNLASFTTSLQTTTSTSQINVSQLVSLPVNGTQNGTQAAQVSADFDMDGKDEIATLYVGSDQKLYLQMSRFNEAPSPGFVTVSTTQLGTSLQKKVWAQTGYSPASEAPALLLAWVDATNTLQLWLSHFDIHLNITSTIQTAGPLLAGNCLFDAATGVITGKHNSELVLAYEGPSDNKGNNLYLSMYSFDGNAFQSELQQTVGVLAGTIPSVQLLTGSFLAATIIDGIVLYYTASDSNAILLTYEYTSPSLQQISTTALPISNSLIRMAAGDLNNDGVEELVVGTVQSTPTVPGFLQLSVYNFANTLQPVLKSQGNVYGDSTFEFISFDYKLAIRMLENNTGMGIVIAALGQENSIMPMEGYARVTIGAVQTNPDLSLNLAFKDARTPAQIPGIFSSNIAYDSTKVMNLSITLCPGDYTGKSIRVGPPRYALVEECQAIIAVVNMVPLETAIGNTGQLTFLNTQSQETSVGLTTHRSYATSDELDASLGLGDFANMKHSISNTYGNDFSKSTESMTEITSGINVQSGWDDFVIMVVNDYDTWEYPVYNKAGDTIEGHILVIFPTANIKRQAIVGGLNYNSYYKPRHLLGNVLSYPGQPPADFDTQSGSYCSQNMELSTIQEAVDANWEKSTDSSIDKTNSQELQIGTSVGLGGLSDFLGGINPGLDYSFQSSYTQSTSSTYDIEYTQQTNITMTLIDMDVSEFDPAKAYIVVPYVYWSTDGGYLKVDYSVQIPPGSSWFQQQYGTANPTLHLPWINSKPPVEFTRDINFSTNSNDTSFQDISVTVHNDTLAATGIIGVAIYNGDPRKGGTQIGTTQNVQSIGPRDLATVTFKAALKPSTDGKYNIYAVVDPSVNLNDPKQVSKIGYGCYPVTAISQSSLKALRTVDLS